MAMLEGLKAVIFDLDGVLFDSRRANIVLYNHMLEHVGLPPRAEDSVEVILRETMQGSLRSLMGEGEKYQKALAYWEVLDPRPFVRELELFPGVRRTLGALGARLTLAVATNRAKTTGMALDFLELTDYFQVVVTPGEAGTSKPDPAFMDVVLGRLGMAKEEVVYVGDSTVDERLCQAAGVRLIAFRNPSLKAWAHVDDMAAIPPLLGA